MPPLPTDPALDSTLALLREGYDFMPRRFARFGGDAFVTRLMLRRATCVRGADAVRMFYVPGRFTRRGAMPPSSLKLLQDRGSALTLDGESHRGRKRMFLALLDAAGVARLVAATEAEWRVAVPRWAQAGEVVLLDAVAAVLARAVCAWAGLSLTEEALRARTQEFAAMISGAGAAGPRLVRGLVLRKRCERWARGVVRAVRSGAGALPAGAPARVLCLHRDQDGRMLDLRVAAIELINLLRPTVAVGRFVTFAALALHEHPGWRDRLRSRPDDATLFAQEVRRYYPFFPAVGGRTMEDFDWHGHHFAKGDWVLLDITGTNRDPRIWGDPDVFRPDRFRDGDGGAFALVAQGGGEHATGHRCPGEEATIALTAAAARLLAAMEYAVPDQDLSIDPARIPARPASGFRIRVFG